MNAPISKVVRRTLIVIGFLVLIILGSFLNMQRIYDTCIESGQPPKTCIRTAIW